jgi:hypothetical protein
MGSVTALTLFCFSDLRSKSWAFMQMQVAHTAMGKTKGLTFFSWPFLFLLLNMAASVL